MKVPALFIGAAVIFWGMETGNFVLSAVVAILLESSQFTARKWQLEEADFVRISDFTSIIFLASVALILLNFEAVSFLKITAEWLPLILLPLILAQRFSTSEKIIIGTQLGLKRKKAYTHKPMDFSISYCVICIFSAAIANSRSDLFFPAAVSLLSWILFVNRGRAFSIPVFIILLSIAAGVGFLGYHGAEKGQKYLAHKVHRYIRSYYWDKYADPFNSHLSFGTLKKLKGSGKILIRVTTEGGTPLLLKQASYDTFFKNTWNSNTAFTYLPVGDKGWQLIPQPAQTGRKAQIELYLPKEKGLLPFPFGSYHVTGENIFELERNPAGTIKIVDAASIVDYDIYYSPELHREDDTPSAKNLRLPENEEYAIGRIAEDLQLQTLAQEEYIPALKRFFQSAFTYSLEIRFGGKEPTPLGNFLLHERRGYCEMFATATALLLRKAGIPSRYVTGFLVEEFSSFEKKYIVRQRHAHAWAEAFINGNWVTVDTTPSSWPEADRENSSFFEPVSDLFAYLKLQYDYFRVQTELKYTFLLSCIIVILTVILGIRVYHRMQADSLEEAPAKSRKTFSRTETPFSLIEHKLSESDIRRGKGEPFLSWAERIATLNKDDLAIITSLYALHQKLRFDPLETTDEEKELLAEGVKEWLARAVETESNFHTHP